MSLYTPKEIAAVFPMDAVENAKNPRKTGNTRPRAEGEPPWVDIFRKANLNPQGPIDLADGTRYEMLCIRDLAHSAPGHGTAMRATFWPDNRLRSIECWHHHCNGWKMPEFVQLFKTLGYENPDGSALPPMSASDEKRPTILIVPPENVVANAARRALASVPGVYVRRGSLTHVYRPHPGKDGTRIIPHGFTCIRNASAPWTRERLSEAAVWERSIKGKEEFERVRSLVPEWVGAMILEDPGQLLPELRAVSTVPVFLSDGTVHATPETLREGVLYVGRSDFPAVANHPTLQDAQAAARRLQELVVDFPWAKTPSPETHRAAWVASLLTVVARYAFDGPSPWVLVEANNPGSGKGLLSHLTCLIATGVGAPVMHCPRDEAELMKSILPVLVDGTRFQINDEVHNNFGGPGWNAMVTATTYKGRILGTSQTVEVPNDTVWFCTGNNVSLAPETTRRCLPIRLEPMDEHPEDRDGFEIQDLLGYAREHQSELLRDALTILRAFHVAGRPESGLKPWGSFEGWTRLIRDAVFWSIGVDCDCRRTLASVADMGQIVHAALIAELYAQFGNHPFTTGSVLEKALSRPNLLTALESACPSKEGKLKAVSVGKRFSSFRRRPVSVKATGKAASDKGVLMLLDQEARDDRQGGALWVIKMAGSVPLQVNGSDK